MQRSEQKADWINKNHKLPREARHTKPLDALGPKREIDRKKQTTEG